MIRFSGTSPLPKCGRSTKRPQLRPFASAAKPGVRAAPEPRGVPAKPSNEAFVTPGPWQKLASVAAALAVGITATAGVAHAVTTEQILFLDAWRAVDRAYVDKDFNGQAWFRVREQYLKKESLNNRKETYNAIRKLLATLEDPFTRFLEPEKLSALRRGTQGTWPWQGQSVKQYQHTTHVLMVPRGTATC
jgi:hypothetical protein